ARGLVTDRLVETLGMKGALVGEVRMEGCGSLGIVGSKPGCGLDQTNSLLSMGAVGIAGMCVGISRACMEISTVHARERTAFGRPIGMYQDIGFKLADMYTLVDLSRMLALRAAWAFDTGGTDAYVLASCAKLFASEAASRVVNWGMQIFAGHGYIAGTDIERLYRDAKFGEICEGTSEILRDSIATVELDRFAARM
ncbi:MAG TPA: acyl-CoA dehydrogenase, partial [Deltaproteobacteria bacterium]|nr:acyl-CoA dehydrogenase [Deltaproteobacteria bacterium]